MKERVPVQEAVASLDQCSIVVDTVQRKEYKRVTVPGVILQEGDREFVAGVYWGRGSYIEEVYAAIDDDGNELRQGTLEEFAACREVKIRDLTSADVIQLIMETAREKEVSEDWRAGFIFGFVIACSDQFYGLACDSCIAHVGECQCKDVLVSNL